MQCCKNVRFWNDAALHTPETKGKCCPGALFQKRLSICGAFGVVRRGVPFDLNLVLFYGRSPVPTGPLAFDDARRDTGVCEWVG